MTIEIVDLPIDSMVIFHRFLYVYQNCLFDDEIASKHQFFGGISGLPRKNQRVAISYHMNMYRAISGSRFDSVYLELKKLGAR